MTRRLIALLTLTAALAAPAGAGASDKTLLSGYGGPGGGEQSALGSVLLPPARGNGSLKASGPRGRVGATAGRSAAASAPAAGAPATEADPQRNGATGAGRPGAGGTAAAAARGKAGSGKKRARGGRNKSAQADVAPRGSAPSATTGEPTAARVAYPRGEAAGALPLGGSDALLLLLGLAGLILVAAVTRGLARRPGDSAPGPDVA